MKNLAKPDMRVPEWWLTDVLVYGLEIAWRDRGPPVSHSRLVDTKPYTQPADPYRCELKPGDPVHDIRLRLAVDDRMTIHEARRSATRPASERGWSRGDRKVPGSKIRAASGGGHSRGGGRRLDGAARPRHRRGAERVNDRLGESHEQVERHEHGYDGTTDVDCEDLDHQ